MLTYAIGTLIGFVIMLYLGYRMGYEDAKNRYERAQVSVFTPEELHALTVMAQEVETRKEVEWLEKQFREE